ncbi:MAG: heparan-alpha-glucosaminide N-acetyltransferase domain-containing protein, partial [Candidatus Kapabacteria bacterium]|nr:heparan-alpha-glucosaminide N-acetyltransferase domain-containing protein [Candidatus Kapabacteria bacterium]
MRGTSLTYRGALSQPYQRGVATAESRRASRTFTVVPDGRLYALDLARFMAMLFMMQGHVLDALVSSSVIDISHAPWNVWHWIRGLTAPVFLMVSGAVHVFATKRDADGRVREDVMGKRIRW